MSTESDTPTSRDEETPTRGYRYLVFYGGGIGPDVWDAEREVYAVDIKDALAQCGDITDDGAWIISVEQSDYSKETTKDQLAKAEADLIRLSAEREKEHNVPLCAHHAEVWFCERHFEPGDCWFCEKDKQIDAANQRRGQAEQACREAQSTLAALQDDYKALSGAYEIARKFMQNVNENGLHAALKAEIASQREEHQNYVEALRSQYVEEGVQLRGQIADKQKVIRVFAKDIADLRAQLAERDRELAEVKAKNEQLADELNWQNKRNSGHPTRGGFEFYINEEWQGIAHAALDSDPGWNASLLKVRFDPDDERVRVRRVMEDNALLSELAEARTQLLAVQTVIANAPHDASCKYVPPILRTELQDCAGIYECTCWKAASPDTTLLDEIVRVLEMAYNREMDWDMLGRAHGNSTVQMWRRAAIDLLSRLRQSTREASK